MDDSQNRWRLGQTSSWYETRGRGAGTISSGRDDHGGASYGEFQLSSAMGTVKEYLDQSSYKQAFEGLEPGTESFNTKWKEMAGQEGFREDQYDFIRKAHYDVQLARLASNGIDLTERGPAVQDAVWSTAVQMRNLTVPVFQNGLKAKFGDDYELAKLTDKEIVEAVQDYKYEQTESLFKRSSNLWESLKDRALKEKKDLAAFAETGFPKDTVARAQAEAASALIGKSSYEWPCPARLDDPAHPDHAFYLHSRSLVHQLDQQNGRTPDQGSNQLASSLTISARAAGLERIDQIALSKDTSTLWGAQRPPGMRDHFFDQHCKVDTVQAMNTPMEQSGAQWPPAMRQFEQRREQLQQQAPQAHQQEQPAQLQPAPAPTM